MRNEYVKIDEDKKLRIVVEKFDSEHIEFHVNHFSGDYEKVKVIKDRYELFFDIPLEYKHSEMKSAVIKELLDEVKQDALKEGCSLFTKKIIFSRAKKTWEEIRVPMLLKPIEQLREEQKIKTIGLEELEKEYEHDLFTCMDKMGEYKREFYLGLLKPEIVQKYNESKKKEKNIVEY